MRGDAARRRRSESPARVLLWGAAVASTAAIQVALVLKAPLLLKPRDGAAPSATAPRDAGLSALGLDYGHELPPLPQEGAPPPLAFSKDLYTGDLDGIVRRRHLRVLTTFNRTNFFLADRQGHGFEFSLLRDFETFLNRGRGKKDLKIHLEFIPVYRDELIPKLLSGEGDVAAAGLTVTPARLTKVDFTDPYLDGIDEVIVTRRGGAKLQGLDDLAGREIHVRRSSSYYESLLSLNEALRDRGLAPVKIAAVDEGLETEDILELVDAGVLGITVADSHLAQIWAGVYESLEVHEGLKVRSGGKIAWMVRKGSPRLRESLNAFVGERRKGTKYGNIYFRRYFRDNPWVERPLSKVTGRLEKHLELFRRYSEKYGIPWLFTAAVAYQESGFDQGKRSGAGAVGIMQVLPSTARDKAIGIADVTDLESNIHAGVKYLAHLRDRYFPDRGLDPASRMNFVLASYNAGPGNIARARARAPSWNVDPDRWFKNVEVVVLRTVGREPVQYVININRYYLLFEHYLQARERREALIRDMAGR